MENAEELPGLFEVYGTEKDEREGGQKCGATREGLGSSRDKVSLRARVFSGVSGLRKEPSKFSPRHPSALSGEICRRFTSEPSTGSGYLSSSVG